MSRRPSIHILEKDLADILEYHLSHDMDRNWQELAKNIAKMAKGKQVSNRKLIVKK